MKKYLKILGIFLILFESQAFSNDINAFIDYGNPQGWCNGAFIKYDYEFKSSLISFNDVLETRVKIQNNGIWLTSETTVPIMGKMKIDRQFDKNTGELIAVYRNGKRVNDYNRTKVTVLLEEEVQIKFKGQNLPALLIKTKITDKSTESIAFFWLHDKFPFGGLVKLEVVGEKKTGSRKDKFNIKADLIDFNEGDC